ncbi:Hypothetical_protein [Hexamita inflata]|uniref:Hypothetical_protein n=1 Tax=Hexamita inflata TaxID=28002 RepID=A0AA86RH32_9EUKA|nr:Hypothetical protein HINF_LOCUS62278 [Hexamita inflata]
MCRGVILLQLQVMLLSDGSVTCLRTQELTIEFMVVPHGINHNGPLYLQLIVLQIMHENSPYFTLRENTSDSTRLQVFWALYSLDLHSILSDTHRYTKKFSNIQLVVSGSFEQSSNFQFWLYLSNIEAQTEFGQETRYRCQRHGNSTKGLVFFSYDSSSFESMALAIFNNAKISAQSNFLTLLSA